MLEIKINYEVMASLPKNYCFRSKCHCPIPSCKIQLLYNKSVSPDLTKLSKGIPIFSLI